MYAIRIHVDYSDQFIAPLEPCHNIKPRFGYPKNFSKECKQGLVRVSVHRSCRYMDLNRAIVHDFDDLIPTCSWCQANRNSGTGRTQ